MPKMVCGQKKQKKVGTSRKNAGTSRKNTLNWKMTSWPIPWQLEASSRVRAEYGCQCCTFRCVLHRGAFCMRESGIWMSGRCFWSGRHMAALRLPATPQQVLDLCVKHEFINAVSIVHEVSMMDSLSMYMCSSKKPTAARSEFNSYRHCHRQRFERRYRGREAAQ